MHSSASNTDAQVIDLRELDALNEAFERQQLGWTWDSETFADLRRIPGVIRQIDEYGFRLGEPLVAHKLYAVVEEFERLFDRIDLSAAA